MNTNNDLNKKIAIMFDLDGTLWNTEEVTLKSFNTISRKYNAEEVSLDAVRRGMGYQKLEALDIYYPNTNKELACKMINEMQELNSKLLNEGGAKLYPNVKETIISLSKQYPLFIVSNTIDQNYINAFLNTSNLNEYFTGSIAAAKLGISKQDAIKKVMKENDIKEAIFVGDTKMDQEAANIDNVKFIYCEYGFGKIENKYSIKELSKLEDLIKSILKN